MAKKAISLLLKRTLDIIGGLAALQLAFGPMLIVALLVRLRLGKPIIFKQLRPGKDGKKFLLMKFRTMNEAPVEEGRRLPDRLRLTPLGSALRRWSLDEYPEIWNVIKGEMSLVGPRPLLIEYLDRFSPEQARRHEVKPGITGWAQVNGRNAITWEEKFRLDVWYVDNISFRLDLKIIAMTISNVIRREGINQLGQATMEEFLGVTTRQGEQENMDSSSIELNGGGAEWENSGV